MSEKLADVSWLQIGSTKKYAEVKKWIAHICRDVTGAACIDEICINDICLGFRQMGYEVINNNYLSLLTARAEAAEAEVNRLREALEEVKVNRDIAWETINRQGGTVDIAMSRLNVCGRIADTALKGGVG